MSWNFVLVPKRFQANQCAGTCPRGYAQESPLPGLMDRATGVWPKPQPCCAPSKLLPMDMIYTDNGKVVHLCFKHHELKKRHSPLNICGERTVRETCCRYPLEINFEIMNWDFVIAPKKFHANYCAGSCPYAYAQESSRPFLVQHMMMHSDDSVTSSGLCCAPTGLLPMDMIFYQDDQISKTVLSNMVVERCSCV